MRRLLGALVLAALPGIGTAAELLPRTFVHLEAARYEPVRDDEHWTGWIGGGAVLAASGPTSFRFLADVETVMGDSRRAFDATQANYHLQLSLWRRVKQWEAGIVFHHVSRHLQDREKEAGVDWNVLRVQAARTHRYGFVELGLGHTTQQSQVGYGWELTARADGVWRPALGGRLYGLASVRAVEAEESEAFARGSFVDVRTEGGVRWVRGTERRLDLFLAWERRHDAPVTSPGERSRALLGFRIGSAGREGLGGL